MPTSAASSLRSTRRAAKWIKFMGDAVLAFFHREDASAACAAALQGAVTALAACNGSKRRIASCVPAWPALRHGVSYGNIGYGHRLGFHLDRSRTSIW